MKIIDTNILVRLAVDEGFSTIIEDSLSESGKGFIHSTVLMESMYVLKSVYGIDKLKICDFLSSVLQNYKIATDEINFVALSLFSEENIDFVDCMVIANAIIYNCLPFSKDKKLNKVHQKYRSLLG
jgi:predicted nucleic-acid-binding protein